SVDRCLSANGLVIASRYHPLVSFPLLAGGFWTPAGSTWFTCHTASALSRSAFSFNDVRGIRGGR
ncbi:MAG: hypothetical protein LBL92_04205, partial [Propionibacteriaceae bacterium]|nr:hypothetical protein [Propionibacteriaceae bacterium]